MSFDKRFDHYFLSGRLVDERSAVFAQAMSLVLDGVHRRMRDGDVKESMADLFIRGKTLDGAEPAGYELGQWKGRLMCEDEPAVFVDGTTYFAWVSPDFWDYEPNLVFFSEAEFKELFVDCCCNFVVAHPERKEEFEQALAANGIR